MGGCQQGDGVGNVNPLQYSCLENSMERGVWQAIPHWVAKSWDMTAQSTAAAERRTEISKTRPDDKKIYEKEMSIYGHYSVNQASGTGHC